MEKLEAEIGRELQNDGFSSTPAPRKSLAPNSGGADREMRRVKQELAQRRLELTELRTEAARALQRAEQENERLRAELATTQQLLEAAIGARRQSGFLNDPRSASDPPVASGIEGRRTAETLRPGARKR
jgi:hypothetical protein